MKLKRESGILLHISSLPSEHGVGDLGVEAFAFVDHLKEMGFSTWQILPLGPVGPGNSPYQAYSAFAGESLFISLNQLVDWNLLEKSDIDSLPRFKRRVVEFDKVKKHKDVLLHKAWANFNLLHFNSLKDEYHAFLDEHGWWLNDYALYAACKSAFNGLAWNHWDADLAKRNPLSIAKYTKQFSANIELEKFIQFLFYRQWFQLKNYANNKGISILGDLPLYVSHDSSDVWGNQSIFYLDEKGDAEILGGVPPDYFSEDGQLWGNPVFNWDKLAETEYQWWISRLYFNFHLFNTVRIDHFRGLESFWAIPKGSETAKTGEWRSAKGFELLRIMNQRLGNLPVVAEDLGLITPEVEALRNAFNLPGMKVLQFAFTSDFENVHLPYNLEGRNIIYTGTHDNNTLLGWLNDLKEEEKNMLEEYVDTKDKGTLQKLVAMVWSSSAELAIIPMQDILLLDENSRMNTPGTSTGNWFWRFDENQLKKKHIEFMRKMNTIYNRNNG